MYEIDINVRFQVIYQSWFWLACTIYIAPAAGTSGQSRALLRLGTSFIYCVRIPAFSSFIPAWDRTASWFRFFPLVACELWLLGQVGHPPSVVDLE